MAPNAGMLNLDTLKGTFPLLPEETLLDCLQQCEGELATACQFLQSQGSTADSTTDPTGASSQLSGTGSADEFPTGLTNVESGSVDDFHTDETISEHNYRGKNSNTLAAMPSSHDNSCPVHRVRKRHCTPRNRAGPVRPRQSNLGGGTWIYETTYIELGNEMIEMKEFVLDTKVARLSWIQGHNVDRLPKAPPKT